MERFYEKDLLLGKLQMSYYPQPENRIRDKVRLILYLSDYATKKNYKMYRHWCIQFTC